MCLLQFTTTNDKRKPQSLVVLALAGQTNSATTLDLFLPNSGSQITGSWIWVRAVLRRFM